jgi:flavodoxin
MRVAVVYESLFGNTRDVAHAIADGLRARPDVSDVALFEVNDAPDTIDADLVVVGGPIHAWSMSRRQTREDARREAAQQGVALVEVPTAAEGQAPRGVREWLEGLAPVSPGHLAATFDTALKTKWFPVGSAAKPEAKRLAARGYTVVADPEHFFVADMHGPLVPGELERARAWASALPAAREGI